jgi:hypothetical protein
VAAISGRVPLQDVRQKLADSRQRARAELTQAGAWGLSSDAVGRIASLSSLYSQAVDEEVLLLSLNAQKQALAFDNDQVDPAFENLLPVSQEQAQELARRAQKAQPFSDLGLLLAVVLSMIFVSLLRCSAQRASRRHSKMQPRLGSRLPLIVGGPLWTAWPRQARAVSPTSTVIAPWPIGGLLPASVAMRTSIGMRRWPIGGAAAGERAYADFDRDHAMADRGASAKERGVASLDALTSVYRRGAGLFVELRREIARARAQEGRSLLPSSTSTGSRASTTASVPRPVTRCCWKSPAP